MRSLIYKDKKIHYRLDIPYPIPEPGEALIRVSMAGICSTDVEILKGYLDFEGIMGHEFSGIVVNADDRELVGKRVVGEINIGCGRCDYCKNNLGNHCPERSVLGILNKSGAFAEYITLPEKNLHQIPATVSDEEAVFVEPIAAAYQILEQFKLSSSDHVCVLGAGRLGLIIAQVLSKTDCELTVIGKHENKLAFLKDMGIETKMVSKHKGRVFDMVIDCTGSPKGLKMAMDFIKPRGTIVLKTTIADQATVDTNQIVIDEITITGSRCGPFEPAIKALSEKTVDVKPLICKTFDLEDGIEALNYTIEKKAMKALLRI